MTAEFSLTRRDHFEYIQESLARDGLHGGPEQFASGFFAERTVFALKRSGYA